MKATKQDNFFVTVTPDVSWRIDQSPENQAKLCRELIAEIKRHVDGFERIDYDCTTTDVCSFCGAAWEQKEDLWNGCCDEDNAEAKAGNVDMVNGGAE